MADNIPAAPAVSGVRAREQDCAPEDEEWPHSRNDSEWEPGEVIVNGRRAPEEAAAPTQNSAVKCGECGEVGHDWTAHKTAPPHTPLDVGELEEVKRLAQALVTTKAAYAAHPWLFPSPHTDYAAAAADARAYDDARRAYFAAVSDPDLISRLVAEVERATEDREKAAAYDRINTPEIDDFLSAVKNEALHQRERWGVDADGGKSFPDWFWLVGYLAGKALHDVKGKRLHHIITAGAALLNWHAHAMGAYARMRPGIEPPASEAAS